MSKLHRSTVPMLLIQTCNTLFQSELFSDFSLGGGLAFALQKNHRRTNEIDLYTNKPFSPADKERLNRFFQYSFGITEHNKIDAKGDNIAFFIYNLNGDYVKVELHYSSLNFEKSDEIEGWRFLSEGDLTTLLLNSLAASGSKAEYWDLHQLLESKEAEELLSNYEKAVTGDKKKIRELICNFERADEDFTPQCLKKKNWNLIKLDIMEAFGR